MKSDFLTNLFFRAQTPVAARIFSLLGQIIHKNVASASLQRAKPMVYYKRYPGRHFCPTHPRCGVNTKGVL